MVMDDFEILNEKSYCFQKPSMADRIKN
jgi:hypothetical protein